jgi:hypothetical protein
MSETAEVEINETPAAAPAADTATPAAESKPAAETAKPTEGPKSLLEAISAAVPGESEEKPAEAAKPVEEAKPDEAAAKPAEEEDLTKMPDGLSQKAQERFQKLAHMNKELTGRVDEITQAVEPFRQALQENGVQREQFDQAAAVIGMMNKGDLQGALNVLDEQRRMISLAMGKPLPGIDALSDFPDLREAVDTMQITEGHALEIARTRSQQLQGQRITEQRQQQERATQQNQEVVSAGLQAVDAFTKKMMATDLDYAAIESKLLPRVPKLLAGVPPNMWADTVSEAYQLIKEAGGVNRQSTTAPALRPTGTPSPASAPKNMLEAMFPSK